MGAMYFYVDIARRSSARRRQTRVGWGKQAILRLNASIPRKLYEILPDLLLMTIGSCMRFRLTPRSTTLDDFELYTFNFQRISRDFADLGGNNS